MNCECGRAALVCAERVSCLVYRPPSVHLGAVILRDAQYSELSDGLLRFKQEVDAWFVQGVLDLRPQESAMSGICASAHPLVLHVYAAVLAKACVNFDTVGGPLLHWPCFLDELLSALMRRSCILWHFIAAHVMLRFARSVDVYRQLGSLTRAFAFTRNDVFDVKYVETRHVALIVDAMAHLLEHAAEKRLTVRLFYKLVNCAKELLRRGDVECYCKLMIALKLSLPSMLLTDFVTRDAHGIVCSLAESCCDDTPQCVYLLVSLLCSDDAERTIASLQEWCALFEQACCQWLSLDDAMDAKLAQLTLFCNPVALNTLPHALPQFLPSVERLFASYPTHTSLRCIMVALGRAS